MRKETQADARK